MLLGGGHWNRVDGHTGKHGWTRKEATDGEGERCETLVRQTWCASRPGKHVKGTLASGPLWERNMARELSGNLGRTVPTMKRRFTGCVAKYCHPC